MPQFIFARQIKSLLQHDMAGGVLLVVASILAMILANTPLFQEFYRDFLALPVQVSVGEFKIAKPLVLWINDGLMAIFFFLIGLEIKREVLAGELATPSQVMLPGLAAVAGIITPALVFFMLNQNDPQALRGWAIPSATDIAFAVGVFTLFKTRTPLSLKLFLLSVAVFDDIGAIVIIAVFYSSELSELSLLIGFIGVGLLFLLNYFNVRQQSFYIVIGIVVWTAVLKSGVHATLAGFAVAMFIPLTVKNNHNQSMLIHMEHEIKPWVNIFILPLFAFANAGVNLTGLQFSDLLQPLPLGIAAGLFIGKQVGIFGMCFLAIKLGIASLPKNATWLQFYAVCVLCGIGFTMSLFIGTLAFEHSPEEYNIQVKIGVLTGTLLSAIVASILLSIKSSGPIRINP